MSDPRVPMPQSSLVLILTAAITERNELRAALKASTDGLADLLVERGISPSSVPQVSRARALLEPAAPQPEGSADVGR